MMTAHEPPFTLSCNVSKSMTIKHLFAVAFSKRGPTGVRTQDPLQIYATRQPKASILPLDHWASSNYWQLKVLVPTNQASALNHPN